jgi:hypothetical protein
LTAAFLTAAFFAGAFVTAAFLTAAFFAGAFVTAAFFAGAFVTAALPAAPLRLVDAMSPLSERLADPRQVAE